MAAETLEYRVNALEQELAQLKQQMQARNVQETEPRWKHIIGVFKDDPLFDEAERLGREWRESQRMEYDDDVLLLTRNLSDFGKVPDLKVEGWSI